MPISCNLNLLLSAYPQIGKAITFLTLSLYLLKQLKKNFHKGSLIYIKYKKEK